MNAPSQRPYEVVLFHSLLGLRPAVLDWADRLRALGHVVHTPDLYEGEVFDDAASAAAWLRRIGFDGMLARAVDSVSTLPTNIVYAGFSNGGACAELLTATRNGARGAVLMHAPLQIRDLGWTSWPQNVPVQVHFAERDPIRGPMVIDALRTRVAASRGAFEEFSYPCAGHLFADSALAAYDGVAADAMWHHVVRFLDRIASEGRDASPDSEGPR